MDQDDQDRNRRLAASIAAGRAPLDAEMIQTMRACATANLDIPGPRVLQLLDELEQLRAYLHRVAVEDEEAERFGRPR